MHRITRVILFVSLVIPATEAEAHLNLTQPASRYDKSTLKSPPCGEGNGPRSDAPTTYRAGETIEVVWNEYIDHPGHFRLAFDRNGQDDFAPPRCTADCDSRQPEFAFDVDESVLVDDIDDKRGGEYHTQITLPDITCDTCTLQVIQVMYDKPPYSVPGNDNYYQCADLKLVDDGEMDAGPTDAADATDASTADVAGSGELPGDAADSSPFNTGALARDTGDGETEPADIGSEPPAVGRDDVATGVDTERGCRVAGGPDKRPSVPMAVTTALLLIARIR